MRTMPTSRPEAGALSGRGLRLSGRAFALPRGEPRGTPSAHLPPTAFVLFLQNHDQIGNRAFGERLTHARATPRRSRRRSPCSCSARRSRCSSWAKRLRVARRSCSSPIITASLADAVREGRRSEFAKFPAFADPASRERIPDPNASTDLRSPRSLKRIRRSAAAREALYRRLIALRATEIVPRLDGAHALTAEAIGPKAVVARWRLGDGAMLTVATNLDAQAVTLDPPAGALLFTNTEMPPGLLPGHCTCAFLDTSRSADV